MIDAAAFEVLGQLAIAGEHGGVEADGLGESRVGLALDHHGGHAELVQQLHDAVTELAEPHDDHVVAQVTGAPGHAFLQTLGEHKRGDVRQQNPKEHESRDGREQVEGLDPL